MGGEGFFLVLQGRDIEHFDEKLASVAEEGVRVEEDAGCHAARRPGAGPRPGSFFIFLHRIFFICSYFFFLLYLLDQVLRQAARIVEQQVKKRVQFVVNSKQCDHILYCHHEISK